MNAAQKELTTSSKLVKDYPANTNQEHDSETSNTSRIIRSAFIQLAPMNMAGVIVDAANPFIDGLIASQALGTEALAALGLFAPINAFIAITYLFTTGYQILCGKPISKNNSEEASSIFSTGVVLRGVLGLAVALFLFIFRGQIPAFLGAEGTTAVLLSEYLAGYAFGVLGIMMTGILLVFLPVNNDTKRGHICIATVAISNIFLNILFIIILDGGIFGLGLATSISYLLSSSIMLLGFTKPGRLLHLRFRNLRPATILKAATLGSPTLANKIGNTVKVYALNIALVMTSGDAGVAAMAVQSSLISLSGAIRTGCSDAFMALGCIYYGDEDRSSLIGAMRYALETSLSMAAIVVLALFLCASLLPSLYFSPQEYAWLETRQMILLSSSYIFLNAISSMILKSYQLQKRVTLVNILRFGSHVLIAGLALALMMPLGSSAVWLAFPLSEVICLAIIATSVFIDAKKITFSLKDWIKLPDDFGALTKNAFEATILSVEEIEDTRKNIFTYCTAYKIPEQTCSAISDLIASILTYLAEKRFRPGVKDAADVRVFVSESCTIRIRDNCAPSDPREQVSTPSILQNAEMSYGSSNSINTLLINVQLFT